jgi:hypothetical protein
MLTSRRDFANLALRAAALPGGAQFLAAWLKGSEEQDEHDHAGHSSAPPETPLLRDYQPKFFDASDFAALQAFTAILIPTDDTPGAREAHCALYIDFVLNAAAEFAPQMQTEWRGAMGSLRSAGFHAADARGREALVEAMSRPERDPALQHPAFNAYRLIKQQNTFAFYTSRVGTIEALDYKGNSYNATFPACSHPEHQKV